MKSVLSVLALSFGLLALGGTAVADDKKLFKPAPKMKLSSNFPVRSSQPIPVFDPVMAAFDVWKRMEPQVRAAYPALVAKDTQCRNAEYSRSEQTAAGCQATESLAQCERKLFERCFRPAHDRFTRVTDDYIRAGDLLKREIGKHMQAARGFSTTSR